MSVKLNNKHENENFAMILNNKKKVNNMNDRKNVIVIKVSKNFELQKRYELEFEFFTNNASNIFINERKIDDFDIQ